MISLPIDPMSKSKEPPPVRGVYAALATPRRAESTEIDAGVLLEYLDTVVKAGVDGLVLFGSTGEFVHFDLEERMRVLGLAIRRSRVPLLVNVSHSTLSGAVALAQHAVASGASGLLLMPPYFYRYSDQQIGAFFEEFARSVGASTRVFLYNLPFFTNPISEQVAEQLLLSGSFAGIKDSSGEQRLMNFLLDLRGRTPFTLMIGSESLYLESRLAGANGIVSGAAAAIPELLVAMERAIAAENLSLARQLNSRLAEFAVWMNRFPATIAIRQAAAARGWKLNQFPFRFDEDTQSEIIAFHRWLSAWLPAMLAECSEVAVVKR